MTVEKWSAAAITTLASTELNSLANAAGVAVSMGLISFLGGVAMGGVLIGGRTTTSVAGVVVVGNLLLGCVLLGLGKVPVSMVGWVGTGGFCTWRTPQAFRNSRAIVSNPP